MLNPKNVVIYCLYVLLEFFLLFLSQRDVVILTSSTDIPEYLIMTSHLAALGLLVLGWITFLILLISFLMVFKFFFRLALGFGVLAYLPMLANFIITLHYAYNEVMNISLLFYIALFIILSIVNILIYTSITGITNSDIAKIKKLVLNLGTRFIKLEIRDISEKSGLNVKKVENVILEMLKNKEIHANFVKETKIIEFNQEANLEELDKLMKIYENWEKETFKKKSN